jgi:hypothetical protein
VTIFLLIFVTSISIAAVFSASQAASPRTDAEKASQPTTAQINIVIDRPEDVYIGSRGDGHSPEPAHFPSSQVIHMGGRDLDAQFVNTPNGPILELDGNQQPVHYDDAELKDQLALWGLPSLRLSGVRILNAPESRIGETLDGENISLVDSPGSTIRNNIISNIKGNSTHPAFGIALDNCSNSVIVNNTIRNIFTNASTAAMTGAAYGIFVNNSENVIISENRIKNVTSQGFDASSGAASAFGIYVENCTGAAISLNNITDILGNSSGNYGACPWAIFMEASNHTLIQANRIGNLTSLGPNNQIQAIHVKDSSRAATLANVTIRGNLFTESLIPDTENADYISRIRIKTEETSSSLINITIENNRFTGTTTSAFGANESSGIRIDSKENVSNLFIAHNWFENMSTTGKASIVYSYGVAVDALAAIDNVTACNNTFIDKSVNAPSGNTYSNGIYIRGSETIENVIVFNNTITDNSATGSWSASRGIYVQSSSITTLINITVTDNFIGDNRAIAIADKAESMGIHLRDTTGGIYDVRVHRNNITDNSAIGNDICSTSGISIVSGSIAGISQVNVTENIVANNSATTTTASSATSIGILVRNPGSISGVRIHANNFTDNSATGAGPAYSYGIWIDCNSPATVTDVTVTENCFADNSATASTTQAKATAHGIFLFDTGNISNVRIQGNNITDNSATATGAESGADSWGIYIKSVDGNISNIRVTRNTVRNSSATGAGFSSPHTVYARGIQIQAGNPMTTDNFTMTNIAVTENVFLDSSAKATGIVTGASSTGILLDGSRANISHVLVSRNNFTDNSVIAPFGGSAVGIQIHCTNDLTNATVTENRFTNNSATLTAPSPAGSPNSYGIYLDSNQKNIDTVRICKNTFTNNSATSLATAGFSGGESHGIYLRSQSGNVSNVWIQENAFTDNSANGETSGGTFKSYGLQISAYDNITNASAIENVFTDNSAAVTDGSADSYGLLFGSRNATQLIVANNTFTDTSTTSSGTSQSNGIRLSTGSGGGITNSLVHGNNITGNSASAGGPTNAYGIYFIGSSAGVINATVSANILSDNAATSTSSTASSYGIYVNSLGDVDTINISSNALTSDLATASSGDARFYGIYIYSSSGNVNNIAVSKNIFTDNWASGASLGYLHGISIGCEYDVSDIVVAENSLTNSSATATSGTAWSYDTFFYSDSGDFNNISVNRNNFTDTTAYGTSGSTSSGVWVENNNDFSNISVTYNQMTNITAMDSGGSADSYGLRVTGVTIPGPSNFTFFRNSIHEVNATAPAGTGTAYGLYLRRVNDSVVDFNLIEGLTATTNDYALYLSRSYGVTFAFEREAAVDITWGDTSITNPPYTDYTGYRNGTWVDKGTWDPPYEVGLEVAGLPYGVYNFTYDIGGGGATNVTETIFVTITDATAPTLTSFPSDLTYEAGTAPPSNLTWTLTDLNPGRYVIYRNGSHVANGTWTSGTPINHSVAGLQVGVYKYTFIANDTFGNVRMHEVFVTVTDTTAPTVTSPTPVTYEAGTTGHNLTWVPTDVHTGTYVVYRNGTEVANGTWTPGSSIIVDIDNLEVGIYSYTIVITDAFANSVTDAVLVTVADTTAPVLTGPADITYGEDPTDPALLLSWTATDLYPGTYAIFQNGTEIASGAWTAGTPIVLELDILTVGVYNFTIVITDASGNSVSDTVIITITEEEPVSETSDEDDGLDPIFLIGGIMVVGVAAVGASGGVAYWFIRIRKKP